MTTATEVFTIAMSMDAAWLAEYHFDTPTISECNGVHAVADTAKDDADAHARIEALKHGTLPPGIFAANDTTEKKLAALWAAWIETIEDEIEAVI